MSFSLIDQFSSLTIAKVELFAFIVIFAWHWLIKTRKKNVLIIAGVMAVGMALSNYVQAEVLPKLDFELRIYIWYLVWAGFSFLQPLAMVVLHVYFGVFLQWRMKVVLLMMSFNTLLNMLLFLDRHVVALNGKPSPNYHPDNAWLLWDLYSVLINVNILFIVVTLLEKENRGRNYIWMLLLYCACWLFVYYLR